MAEYFDIYDENGNTTGDVVLRNIAHEKGILHAAVHIYIYRFRNGRCEILLQKRSDDKDSFPSCWDTSCAGHVSAGDSFEDAAVRELGEELGIKVDVSDLQILFTRLVDKHNTFHNKPFNDHEIFKVYALELDTPAEDLTFQKEEISALRWIDSQYLSERLRAKDPSYCIMADVYEDAKKLIHHS